MVSVVVIVHYRAQPGAAEVVAGALGQMLKPTRAEPGNLVYAVCRSASEPEVFAIYEEYADEQALAAHAASPHFEIWLRGQVLPNLSERTRHDLVPLSCRDS